MEDPNGSPDTSDEDSQHSIEDIEDSNGSPDLSHEDSQHSIEDSNGSIDSSDEDSQHSIETLNVLGCKPGSTSQTMDLNNKEDMQGILQCLEIQGYVVLKEVTTLKEQWEGGIQDVSNDVRVNKIINAARSGGFIISFYKAAQIGPLQDDFFLDPVAAEGPNFTRFVAYHLGGETTSARWVVSVNKGEYGYVLRDYRDVECEAGDIFLGNARMAHIHPHPVVPLGETINMIMCCYVAKEVEDTEE